MMPGTFLLNAKYYQEIASDVAMDRAKNVKMGLEIMTPAGIFTGCVKVRETTPLEPDDVSIKYCPGLGLVFDDRLKLVDHGMTFCNRHNHR